MNAKFYGFAALAMGVALSAPVHAATLLYKQDFENPNGYHNDGGDVNIHRTVNDNYANQPAGFTFSQTNTVETLNVSGSQRGTGDAAFGSGWKDPSHTGGNFAIGIQQYFEDDRLGLAFNVGDLAYFNVAMDVSSIDLDRYAAPFVGAGVVPTFRFSLYDNPTGAPGVSGGKLLSSYDFTGVASPRDVFQWSHAVFGLSTAGNTNGNVIFQIDLLEGGYAAMDNFVLTADDVAPAPVPVPAAGLLLLSGVGAMGALRRRRNRA